MTDPQLPDGTTAADIDKHFGGEPDEYVAIANISVTFRVDAWGSDDIKEKLTHEVQNHVTGDLEVEHVELIDIERA